MEKVHWIEPFSTRNRSVWHKRFGNGIILLTLKLPFLYFKVDCSLQSRLLSSVKYSTSSKPDQTKPTPTMLPTTQSISKKTKGPSTRTDTSTNRTIGIGTLRNVFLVMGVLVLLSFFRIYNSSIMIAYATESEFVPDTTDLVAANASTALVAQKKDSKLSSMRVDAARRCKWV
jgi:hypothetical protein